MTDDIQTSPGTRRTQWDKAAPGWEKHGAEIRDWLRHPTAEMMDKAGLVAGQTVLDVAAGSGDQSLDLAARVGPDGQVVATDISAVMLDFAKANATAAGYANVRTHLADAQDLRLPDASFDAAICRLGLMFLPDPLAGLRELWRVLKPGGRCCTLVFAGPEANPCLGILMSTAMRHAGLPPGDPFRPGGLVSLGRPGHLDDLFAAAGFREVTTTRIDAPINLPTVTHYLDFIRDAAGPILQIMAALGPEARHAAWEEMAERLAVYQTPQGWSGPNTLLLTVGTH
jgi:SAM-dependent methyltransferase